MKNMSDNFRNFLTLIVLLFCFGFNFMATYYPGKGDVAMAQGQSFMNQIAMIIVGYIWGSSVGSSRKAETIDKMIAPSTETKTTITTEKPNELPHEESKQL